MHAAERKKILLPDNNALVKRVRDIANYEIPFALKWNDRAKNWKWEINVVKSPEVRMYCLPSGKIVVYSGLIDKLHLNDNEIGMMLGHENLISCTHMTSDFCSPNQSKKPFFAAERMPFRLAGNHAEHILPLLRSVCTIRFRRVRQAWM